MGKFTKINWYGDDGVDRGFLRKVGRNWWFDESFPHSFKYFDPSAMYHKGFVSRDINDEFADKYVETFLRYAQAILGKYPDTVLEIGCAEGRFTRRLMDSYVDVLGIDGSESAVRYGEVEYGLGRRIQQYDMREPFDMGKTYDFVICTEMAEHIECSFAATLVRSLICHSMLIWFSSDGISSMAGPHYGHCNEQPPRFWQELFRYFGYGAIMLPEDVQCLAPDGARSGTRQLFYNKILHDPYFSNINLAVAGTPVEEQDEVESLGYNIV